MGLADEINSNLDALYHEMLAVNAQDAFSITIAATVRRVIDTAPVTLTIARPPAAVKATAPADDTIPETLVVGHSTIDAPASGDPASGEAPKRQKKSNGEVSRTPAKPGSSKTNAA